MKRTKTLRRRCDRPACGKQYRYSKASSRTCSSICRQRLFQERKKAAAQVAQEQLEAQAQARAARMQARYAGPYVRRQKPSVNGRSSPIARPRLRHAPPRPHLHPRQHPGHTPTYRPTGAPEPQTVVPSGTESRTRPRSSCVTTRQSLQNAPPILYKRDINLTPFRSRPFLMGGAR